MSAALRLSHTASNTMAVCGAMYRYRYIDRLRSRNRPAALVFGTAIDAAISGHLLAQAVGEENDPVAAFEAAWEAALAAHPIRYPAGMDPARMADMGQSMMALFAQDWADRGWVPMVDMGGDPIVQRHLEVALDETTRFRGVIDAVVITPEGKVLVVDFKTASTTAPGLQLVADQLTAYQVLVEANARTLGVRVDGLCFYSLIKRAPGPRGGGPKIEVEPPAPPRSAGELRAWAREQLAIAQDIRGGRFARRPGMAYNSPCRGCEYQQLCWYGDAKDLVVAE